MTGWIKIHRELMEKAIWKCSSPEQKAILITLLMMASHKEQEWEWQGKKFTIKPGQFITSLKSIRENAGSGISIQNVRTALERFEKYEFLTSKSTNKNRLITVANWGLYQEQDDKLTSKLTSSQQAANNYQECKNERSNISAQFDAFWQAYPRKIGKQKALKVFEKLKPDNTLLSTMINKIEAYKKTEQWQKNNGQFIPHPTTWLNEGRWEDEIEGGSSFVPQYKFVD